MKDKLSWWPVAMVYATWRVFLALVYARPHTPSYFANLFYFVDIWMNALCGGNPLVTVSARTGYYSKYYGVRENFTASFWRYCERCVNWAFKPIDGIDHCAQASEWAEVVLRDQYGNAAHIHHGPMVLFIMLGPIVTLSCIILGPLIRLLHGIGIMPKNKRFDREAYEKEKQLWKP